MKLCFSLFLAFILSNCSTTQVKPSEKSENLDVVELSKGLSNEKKEQLPITEIISPVSAFQWQTFFKGTPNSKERPMLQESMKQLTNASTAEDLLKRGRNEAALGLLSAAESSFRQALRKDSKNVDALLELASILQKQRRSAASFDVLAEAKNNLHSLERPDQSQVFRYRYTLALTYLMTGDRPKSHAILSDLIGKDRTFLPGYAALAFSYLKEGKDTVARFIVEQALDRGGDHPALYNILGILSERQGKPAVAKDFYNRALGFNDSFAPALVNRGNLYMGNGEFSMAEADYKKALNVDPGSADAMIGLGVALRQTGRYSAAKDTFERALDLDADNPQARFNLAILMRENIKDEGQALRYFNEVTQSERANQGLKSLARSAIEEIRSL